MILVLNFADLDFHHQSLIPHPETKNTEKRAIELGGNWSLAFALLWLNSRSGSPPGTPGQMGVDSKSPDHFHRRFFGC